MQIVYYKSYRNTEFWTIQGVCYGYIEAYYEKAYSQKLNDYRYKQPSLLETKSMTIDDKHPLFNCKTTDINRMVRETPASELFLSALWQVQSVHHQIIAGN